MPGVQSSVLSRLDALVGDGVEAAVRLKHRRRLRRLGWEHAFDPNSGALWATGGAPPRDGCSLKVLVDGASALPEMARAMQSARESIHITGWHLEPAFAVDRGERHTILGVMLAELAERLDVRILVWAGAPVPAFHPTRSEVQEGVRNLVRSTRIRCETDPREHPFHCHHEKTMIIDDELAFVGGIDLTDSSGDRFDSQAHVARRRLGWHDVGTRLRGPAVTDVADHFRMRWLELTGETLARRADAVGPAGGQTVHVVRTVAEGMYDRVPHGDFTILASYVRALRSAQRLIYLENQFLWSVEIVSILAEKLRNPPHPDFRVVVLLPAKPNNGRDDTLGQLAVLVDADEGDRLLAATIRSFSDGRADPLYVHAKVGIVDDRWLTVGSANLNARSLLNDTEMNVVTDDAELARDTRVRLWAEHLELDRAAVAATETRTLVDDYWRPIATEQLERRDAGAPPTHRLLALPGVSTRSGRLLGPLQGLVDDG
jgi:phosphatidylserine/phosphatidylglycerophosphate/cardiolipin synthase-like enzyme